MSMIGLLDSDCIKSIFMDQNSNINNTMQSDELAHLPKVYSVITGASDQNQNSLLVIRQIDNPSLGAVTGGN